MFTSKTLYPDFVGRIAQYSFCHSQKFWISEKLKQIFIKIWTSFTASNQLKNFL